MLAKGEVYNENSIGPKTEPCGTPYCKRLGWEITDSTFTD